MSMNPLAVRIDRQVLFSNFFLSLLPPLKLTEGYRIIPVHKLNVAK